MMFDIPNTFKTTISLYEFCPESQENAALTQKEAQSTITTAYEALYMHYPPQKMTWSF